MNSRLLNTTLLLAISAIGPAGCTTLQPPPPAGVPDPFPDSPQIVVLDELDRYVFISNVVMQPGPPMDVTVIARANTRDTEPKVQYRFLFLDSHGRRLESQPDWRYLQMPARAAVEFRGNAMDSRAADWRLEIRPAR
ncbi:MAG: DUF1425 domain-containing protein [Planctomycetes bacterium]|nr:DUF1425 domain-containing protein [Planctomycetota bacterium]